MKNYLICCQWISSGLLLILVIILYNQLFGQLLKVSLLCKLDPLFRFLFS